MDWGRVNKSFEKSKKVKKQLKSKWGFQEVVDVNNKKIHKQKNNSTDRSGTILVSVPIFMQFENEKRSYIKTDF